MSPSIRPEQASAFGPAPCAPCAAAAAAGGAAPRPAPAAAFSGSVGRSVEIVDPAKTGWIVVKVVDPEDDPVAGVPLTVELPDGTHVAPRTDRKGTVRLEGIASGICTVSLADPRHVVVESYKVKTGDSIDSLARARGWTWQALAMLNWGTDKPSQINEHLRDDVGCTRTTPSGKNYIFTSNDVPGTMLLPKDPHKLATEQEHILKLHRDPGPFIMLESEVGVPIPDAGFFARFADGSTLNGRLDRRGRHRLIDAPPGNFVVQYPDPDDVLAKALAGMARRGFELPDGALDDEEAELTPTAYLFRLLQHDTPIVRAAFAAYDTWWNDRSGRGLRADIEEMVTDEEARVMFSMLLVHHGMEPLVPLVLHPVDQQLEPDELPE